MTKRSYRLLLVLYIVLGVIGVTMDVAFPTLIPEVYLEAQEYHEASFAYSPAVLVSFFALIISILVSVYGLFAFRHWAPKFALASTMLGWIFSCFLSPSVISSPAEAIFGLSDYMWGACLVLAFVPPYSHWFKRDAPPADFSSDRDHPMP